MPRIKANIVAVTVKIDAQASALFLKGYDNPKGPQTWRHELGSWAGEMIQAGHTIKYDMFWRSDAPWPACGCPQKRAAPNAFQGMLDKEGAGRRLEDIRFEPLRLDRLTYSKTKMTHATFKAQAS